MKENLVVLKRQHRLQPRGQEAKVCVGINLDALDISKSFELHETRGRCVTTCTLGARKRLMKSRVKVNALLDYFKNNMT